MNYSIWKKEVDDFLKDVSKSLSKSQRERIFEFMKENMEKYKFVTFNSSPVTTIELTDKQKESLNTGVNKF